MEVIFFVLFFIVGTIFGSFYNVVGLRLPQNISFVHGHSSCPYCKNQLRWYELIPILSYVLQQGKCNRCKQHLSKIYPLIEIVTGCLFACSYLHFGLVWGLVPTLLFISFLIIVTVTDLTYMIIPNKLLLFFLPLFIFIRITYPLEPAYDAVLGSIGGLLLIAMIIFISKGGMGLGDMKLFAVIGIVLGLQGILVSFFIAVCTGGIIGGYLLFSRKKTRKSAIPFGPFLVLGSIISYFYGDVLFNFYVSFII